MNAILPVLSSLTKRTRTVSTLMDAAYDFAVEIRDGKWDHVVGIRSKPVPVCPEVVDELRRRCPGHSNLEYQRAIADGLFSSR
jgi:hypothetical protein